VCWLFLLCPVRSGTCPARIRSVRHILAQPVDHHPVGQSAGLPAATRFHVEIYDMNTDRGHCQCPGDHSQAARRATSARLLCSRAEVTKRLIGGIPVCFTCTMRLNFKALNRPRSERTPLCLLLVLCGNKDPNTRLHSSCSLSVMPPRPAAGLEA